MLVYEWFRENDVSTMRYKCQTSYNSMESVSVFVSYISKCVHSLGSESRVWLNDSDFENNIKSKVKLKQFIKHIFIVSTLLVKSTCCEYVLVLMLKLYKFQWNWYQNFTYIIALVSLSFTKQCSKSQNTSFVQVPCSFPNFI